MGDFDNQWVEVFRAGDYGAKGNWPVEKLRKVVANLNPAVWQPPAVFGHPEHDAPAMGWVKELSSEGGKLLARFEKVHPALEAGVQEGRYPNRSAAFYLDPEGKGPMLRHVGFLGAMPPEVKGLAPIRFSDDRFVAIEYQESAMTEADRDLDRMIDRALQPLKLTLDALHAKFAEGGPRPPVPREPNPPAPKPPSVLMGEIKVGPSRGLAFKNVDLARRIMGIRMEAKKCGGSVSYSEAREIAIAEGFKPE